MSVSVRFERASAKVYGSERKGLWKRAQRFMEASGMGKDQIRSSLSCPRGGETNAQSNYMWESGLI